MQYIFCTLLQIFIRLYYLHKIDKQHSLDI
jgi:hypothetical protein